MDRDETLAPSISKLPSPLLCFTTFFFPSARLATNFYSTTLPYRCYDYEMLFLAWRKVLVSGRWERLGTTSPGVSDFHLVQSPIVPVIFINFIYLVFVNFLVLFVLLCYLKIFGGSFLPLFEKIMRLVLFCYCLFYLFLISSPTLLFLFFFFFFFLF